MSDGRIALNGHWDFLHLADDRVSGPARVREISVPGVWQAQFQDLRTRIGIGLYTRTFDLEAELPQTPTWLHFDAAFYNSRVWINDELVGEHHGGFLPFSFDVSRFLRPGSNKITVRVDSPTDDPEDFPDAPLAEIPFGKQSWYGPWSGIWQSVWLERRPLDHIQRVHITPDRETGRVAVRVGLRAPAAAPSMIRLQVRNSEGDLCASADVEVPAGSDGCDLDAKLSEVNPWSPGNPVLYRAELELQRDGSKRDHVSKRFGFRTIEARQGRLYLNGELLYLRGALDQDYYPDTIATPPSTDFLRSQLLKAKELGLNCIRLHIKAPDPRYYDLADELGLLIWAELPNGGMSTPKSRARKEELLKGIVDRDWNHPCIVIWTIINENWGVDLVHDADHRDWLKQTYLWLKSYDPLRLVVDNSPLAPSFHVQTDLADYHFYTAIPDHREDWDAFVETLAHRPNWLFSPEGDAVVTGNEPLMVSEFGNWGLPFPRDLQAADGSEPWWFETGHDWGEGVMYPHGVENRFLDWSLDRAFGTFDRFIEATQWQQFRALKYQIEVIRRHPSLAGYVVTELTDCHWESNGLLDMRRNPRRFHDVFSTINADVVIAPRLERFACWAGESAHVDVAIANSSCRTIEGAWLEISTVGYSDRVQIPRLDSGVVLNLGWIDCPVPEVGMPVMMRWRLTLCTPEGHEISRNTFDLAVHPRRATPAMQNLVWSPDQAVRARLDVLGFRVADSMEETGLIVATAHDGEIAAAVRAGKRAIFLLDSADTLHPFFPHWQNVRVLARKGTSWQGDWASSFSWLKRQGAFRELPGGPLLDETFDRVIPDYVISGCNLLDFQSRVHAGLVVGWIHKPVALLVERPYGRGRVVASTLRLMRDPAGTDPTATRLFDSIVSLAMREIAAPADVPRAAKGDSLEPAPQVQIRQGRP